MPMQEQPQMVLAIAKLRSLSQLNGGGLTGASVSEAPVLIITVVSCSSLDQEPLLSSIPSPIQSGHTWAAGRGKARLFSLHLMVATYGMWILLVHLSDSKVRAVKSDHHHWRGFHLRDRFQIPSLVRCYVTQPQAPGCKGSGDTGTTRDKIPSNSVGEAHISCCATVFPGNLSCFSHFSYAALYSTPVCCMTRRDLFHSRWMRSLIYWLTLLSCSWYTQPMLIQFNWSVDQGENKVFSNTAVEKSKTCAKGI